MAMQREIDVKNLRFYAAMAKDCDWHTDVIHKSVITQTLNEIADRLEAIIQCRDCGRGDVTLCLRFGHQHVSVAYDHATGKKVVTPDPCHDPKIMKLQH